MSTESKGAWVAIGQLSVVVAILVGAVQIYQYVASDGPSLRVQGSSYPIRTSPVSSQDIISRFDIATALPSDLKEREKIEEKIFTKINTTLLREMNKRPSPILEPKAVEINITNEGNRESQDLTIQFSTSGKYELRRAGEPVKIDSFEQVIPLGNLRVNHTISLTVWPRFFEEWHQDDVKVSHSTGTMGVDFAVPINGWMAVPFHSPLSTFFVCLLTLIGTFFLGGIIAEKSLKSKKTDEKVDTSKIEQKVETNKTEDASPPSPS